MKLTFEQIKGALTGAVDAEITEGYIRPLRYNEREREEYLTKRGGYHYQLVSSSGIKLRFVTDSGNLYIRTSHKQGSSRNYYSIDLFVDGKYIGSADNFSEVTVPKAYSGLSLPLEKLEKCFSLGKGRKEVCIYLPWSVSCDIEEISLDDAAEYSPVKRNRTVLFYGDSITQGYDAMRPSNKYTSLIADMLDAEEYNKGYGADFCFPELAAVKNDISPDYIFIAYGTNDWWSHTRDGFTMRYKAFLENVTNNHPDAKVFAITPIWRKDHIEEKSFGSFSAVEDIIRNVSEGFENVKVIRGFELVPQNEDMYADLRLHPNDEGFVRYAENLYKEM